MDTRITVFNKYQIRSNRWFYYRWSLVAFAFTTVLMASFGGNVQAQQCTAATGPSSWCDILFTENVDVSGAPPNLLTALGLSTTTNPVTIQRTARVWTGDGTLARPPVVVYNGGAGSTAASNSGGGWALGFEAEWPEAIVVYTEATRLTSHSTFFDCIWDSPPPHICWSPRFPRCEAEPIHSDLGYMERVLDEVDNLFPYNHDQVYASGHSSGGFFTLSLMHLMPETFRAFAVLGCFADFEREGDDIAAIVAAGQKTPSKPVLYMMGESEDRFPWRPAVPGANDFVFDTIRQLTARNGTEVPSQSDRSYLNDLTNDVRSFEPAKGVRSVVFDPVKPNSAQVVLTVYRGDHSWPPRDADPNLRAVEWVVDFFQRHQCVDPEVPNILFDQGWTVPVLMAPVIF